MALIYVNSGFHTTFFVSGAIAFLTAVMAYIYIRKLGATSA